MLGISAASSGSGLIPRLSRLDVEDEGPADKGFDAACRPFAAGFVVSCEVELARSGEFGMTTSLTLTGRDRLGLSAIPSLEGRDRD